MRVNPFAIALQVMTAVENIASLQPGESDNLPVIHISDKGSHLDIAITVSKDVTPGDGTTHLPSSKD